MFKPNFFCRKISSAILIFQILVFLSACNFSKNNPAFSNENLKKFPRVILWAWERPEDLRFVDSRKIGVAFLAQTLVMQTDEVILRPRRQPLEVNPETFLIAVTRIETNKRNNILRPALSDEQKNKILYLIKQTLTMPGVKAVQIDFDAAVSERIFYQQMLKDLRAELPTDVSLTMTALASWCVSDNWFAGAPVDEAVPMAFRMGADDRQIRAFLASEKDWREPLCRGSYGLATDEPLSIKFRTNRRFYFFNDRPWRDADLKNLPEGVL